MKQRITKKRLGDLVENLNKLKKTPIIPYSKKEDGGYKSNIGNYHLSFAYSGVSLHQMTNNGGVRDVLNVGHVTKRELFNLIRAYMTD